jgi:tetratricopeptide (TPR) repeat protein
MVSGKYVTGRCPVCGGEVQLDESKEKGFCIHCGNEIIKEVAVSKLKVEVAGSVAFNYDLEKIKRNAQISYDAGQYQNAYDDWARVVEMDKVDHESWFGMVKCLSANSKYPRRNFSKYTDYSYYISEYREYSYAVSYAPPDVAEKYRSFAKDFDAAVTRNMKNERDNEKSTRRFIFGIGVITLLVGVGIVAISIHFESVVGFIIGAIIAIFGIYFCKNALFD